MNNGHTADRQPVFRIEVRTHCDTELAAGSRYVETARQLGIGQLIACQEIKLYFVGGDVTLHHIHRLAQDLLTDPVTETFEIIDATITGSVAERTEASPLAERSSYIQSVQPDHIIDVTLLPGVTDPPAENLVRAARLLGVTGLERAAVGQCFLLWGRLPEHDLERLAEEVFSNPVIQRAVIDRPIEPPFVPSASTDDTVETIRLQFAEPDGLAEISRARRLALDVDEMLAIQRYFQDEERDPTDAELEMLAQTWSEHCVHKTFKAWIEVEGQRTVNGLLHTYIRAATEEINKPWVRSAFTDNAGIVAFDDQFDLAFKVETHNHPSALEPFGGANTGVGGVVRDILGVSARPIANTDVLCFGPTDLPASELPAGVLHPRRIAEGVVHGIEDYGNKMGIPTVNGAILYHPGYTANPLVFCGCLGILPRGAHPSRPEPGDLIVVVGGRTGRDGLRGATFSSMEMDHATGQIAGSAVQIGHPIHEKQVQEAILQARDEKLYTAITDCGAGGLSSAVGEMGRRVGAQVQLESVPLKYPGLRPWEIWLSEAQERMVLAVPQDNWQRLRDICAGLDIEAVCIGQFESTERLKLYYGERVVADVSMDFLHEGIPRRKLKAARLQSPISNLRSPISIHHSSELRSRLLQWLASPDVRSKEPVVRRYDHEVQGGSAVKPFVGVDQHGPSDAAVLRPLDAVIGCRQQTTPDRHQAAQLGVALSTGICPQYGEIDPYAMAWAAIDEAMRNAVAVGADPDRIALLDNFCWGNPNLPDRLGSLVRCAQGCYDAAIAYQAPFVSGKDSLNNEYVGVDGRKHAIPGTLLISALGIVPDIARTCTMDLKAPGNRLYLVGDTRHEYPPQPVPEPLDRLRAVHRAIALGLAQSCHDCSEGGLGVAVAEMCLAGRLGADIDLTAVPLDCRAGGSTYIADDGLGQAGGLPYMMDGDILFSESLCRFVIEVKAEHAAAFEHILLGLPFACIGQVTDTPELTVRGRDGELFRAAVTDLERAWRGEEERSAAGGRRPEAAGQRPDERGRRQDTEERSPISNLQSPVRRPRVLVLHATGTNRDREAALACELAGGDPEIVHVNQLLNGARHLLDYHMLVVPGGFSYGDDLGAGTLWSLDLRHRLGDDVARFVAEGRPVLGICNGFQALVKSGLLPWGEVPPRETDTQAPARQVTLTYNRSLHFECRWVYLKPNPASPCLFTRGLPDLVYCPVAHGEGRLMISGEGTLARLQSQELIALTYVDERGEPAAYPYNPNGSIASIAGLCNPAGNVLGLMPHPENHIFDWQHPRRHRGERGMSGLRLFENGIRAA